MRHKNIKRAARALFLSQADDKNKLLANRIQDEEVAELVKDQGRVLVVLEKLVLPYKKDAYTQEEMESILYKKLRKKGHRIQDDEEEDDEQYAAEKRNAREARLAMVPSLLGMTLEENEKPEQPEPEYPNFLGPDAIFIQPPVTVETSPGHTTTIFDWASLDESFDLNAAPYFDNIGNFVEKEVEKDLLLAAIGVAGIGLALFAWLRR